MVWDVVLQESSELVFRERTVACTRIVATPGVRQRVRQMAPHDRMSGGLLELAAQRADGRGWVALPGLRLNTSVGSGRAGARVPWVLRMSEPATAAGHASMSGHIEVRPRMFHEASRL